MSSSNQTTIAGLQAKSYSLGVEIKIGDEVYKPIVEGEQVVWEEVKSAVIDDKMLDEFDCSNYTFFLIGDEEKCRPCFNALEDINKYADRMDEDDTVKKWKYDMINKCMEGKEREAWVRREKQRDEQFRGYSTIPQIWHKGKFIGGLKELRNLLRDEFKEDDLDVKNETKTKE
jgi:L-rhamnose mutarotase